MKAPFQREWRHVGTPTLQKYEHMVAKLPDEIPSGEKLLESTTGVTAAVVEWQWKNTESQERAKGKNGEKRRRNWSSTKKDSVSAVIVIARILVSRVRVWL